MRKTLVRARVPFTITILVLCAAVLYACHSSERRAQQYYEDALRQKSRQNFQEALRLLHLALAEDRDHLASYIEIGILLSRDKDYRQALTYFRAAEKLGADSYSLSSLFGYAYEELGDFQQAEFYYEQAISQAPRLIDVRLRLANILEWQDRGQEAAELLRQALELAPGLEGADDLKARVEVLSRMEGRERHLALADIYFRQGKPRRGTAEYQKAADLSGEDPAGQILFGRFCLEREQFKLALNAFQQAQQQGAVQDFQLSHDMALAFEQLGRFDDAVQEYRRALGFDPQDAPLYLKLAELLEKTGRNEEAAESLEQLYHLSLHTTDLQSEHDALPAANQLWQDILRLRGESHSRTVFCIEDPRKAIVVPVTVNQTHDVVMRVEDELEYTILSDRVTESLGIHITARTSEVRFNIYGHVETAALVTLPSLKVGEMEARNIPVLIGDLSRYPDIDGFLGKNFLKHFKVEINNEDRLFILKKLHV